MKRLLILLVFGSIFLSGCTRHPEIKNLKHPITRIVCFGDSLTAGEGAGEGEDYPAVLSRLTGKETINAGVSGDTTADALKRIEKDVLEWDPNLVIVLLGGNDFLQKIPQKETFRNIEKIVDLIQAKGAAVVLVEVRTGLLKDPYLSSFKDIARQKGALLVPDILSGIITNPDLVSDGLHPNAKGYQKMAQRIYQRIKPYL